VRLGGIRLLDYSARGLWSHVAWGKHCAGKPEALFGALEVAPDTYYHKRRHMRYGHRVVKDLKELMRETGERFEIPSPWSGKKLDRSVRISPAGGSYADGAEVKVSLSTTVKSAEIRYTLNGTEPGTGSRPYSAPFSLTDSATVRAAAFKDEKRAGPSAAASFVFLKPRDPDSPGRTSPGLAYNYYHGSWERLPDFGKLRPLKTGTVEAFDLGVQSRSEEFGIVYSGFVEIEKAGPYKFYTRSDDGSKLWIGSLEVVTNDGLHGPEERSGQIVLRPGKHAIRVAFFEKSGGEALEVLYEGPGVKKGPVPAGVLSH
jgi:hypothetical protein